MEERQLLAIPPGRDDLPLDNAEMGAMLLRNIQSMEARMLSSIEVHLLQIYIVYIVHVCCDHELWMPDIDCIWYH
jgi:hypothetical protein